MSGFGMPEERRRRPLPLADSGMYHTAVHVVAYRVCVLTAIRDLNPYVPVLYARSAQNHTL
jgi:hypothetical protein